MGLAVPHANRGRGFEKTLEFVHMVYAQKDIAYIEKKEVPRTVRNGKTIYLAKTGFDYEGMFVGSGRYICMEAKEHRDRLPVDERYGIRPHQLKALIRYGKAGAWSGIVWNISNLNETYLLDWKFLEEFMADIYGIRKERGRTIKSIRADHVRDSCIMVDHEGIPDYLIALGKENKWTLKN